MTLSVSDFSDRFLKGAMIQLANSVDMKLAALYKNVWNWVGTPASVISTYAAYGRGPQRLDEMAVPAGERVGALSPADTWGLIPSVAGLYIADSAKSALQKAKLPMLGNTDLYSSQNIQTHTVGPLGGSPLVNGAAQNVTYDGSNAQSLITDGWTAAAAARVKKGDVFTVAGVFAVNPVTRGAPYLQQFVINATAVRTAGNLTLNISPAIITSGAYQTVSAALADNAVMT